MSSALVLAQATLEEETTATAAAVAVGVFVLIAILSIIGVATKTGRRLMLPVTAVLLGAAIIVTTIAEASSNGVSPITFIGLFFGVLVAVGGAGALREGMVVPDVEGVEPDPKGRTTPPPPPPGSFGS